MSTLAFTGAVAPPLWLNHKWGWRYTDAAVDFSAAEVDIYADKVGAETPTRATLTHASGGVTRANGYIDCDQLGTWVAANLSAGTWRVHLLADKCELAVWVFQVLTPDAGVYNP